MIISTEFRTPVRELSMVIVTELTSFTTAIKSSISEPIKVQELYKMIKLNKCNNNTNKPRVVLKQAVQIQEKK